MFSVILTVRNILTYYSLQLKYKKKNRYKNKYV